MYCFSNFCRICVKSRKNLAAFDEELLAKFFFCFPELKQNYENDTRPYLICGTCIGRLKITHNFKLCCVNGNKLLTDYKSLLRIDHNSKQGQMKFDLSKFDESSTKCNKIELKTKKHIAFPSNLGSLSVSIGLLNTVPEVKSVDTVFEIKNVHTVSDVTNDDTVSSVTNIDAVSDVMNADTISNVTNIDAVSDVLSADTSSVVTASDDKDADTSSDDKNADTDSDDKNVNSEVESGDVEMTSGSLRCQICSAVFSNCEELDVHLHDHLTNRQFKCNICNMSFSHKESLTMHQKIHPNPFKCDICGEMFKVKPNLVWHKKKHRKIKIKSATPSLKMTFRKEENKPNANASDEIIPEYSVKQKSETDLCQKSVDLDLCSLCGAMVDIHHVCSLSS